MKQTAIIPRNGLRVWVMAHDSGTRRKIASAGTIAGPHAPDAKFCRVCLDAQPDAPPMLWPTAEVFVLEKDDEWRFAPDDGLRPRL